MTNCLGAAEIRALEHLKSAKAQAAESWSVEGAVRSREAAVVGAGTMGRGIALSIASAGIGVTLVDTNAEALKAARDAIEADVERAVARGRLSRSAGEVAIEKIYWADDISAIPDVGIIIEAVFERLELKQEIIAALDRRFAGRTILATNTSTLDIDTIAAASNHPDRVVGLHFFSPANVMPLIEIVKGSATGSDVIATSVRLAMALSKSGIVVGNCYGFAGNRMVEGMGREANRLLLEGTGVEEIDSALRAFGMAMGPLEVADLVGIDVPYQARRANSQALPGDTAYYRMADRLFELGRFGRKTGRGYYLHRPTSGGGADPDIARLAQIERERLRVTPRIAAATEIVDRCVLPLVNEGARILEEGIAERASDLDLIFTLGYGFPATLGGPMHYADSVGVAQILSRIERYRRAGGDYWEPAPLLRRLAANGQGFGDFDQDRRKGKGGTA